jgi:multidrug resistance efflux pump
MVAVLAVPLMLVYDPQVVSTINAGAAQFPDAVKPMNADGSSLTIRFVMIAITAAVIGWAIWRSKRSSHATEAVVVKAE